MPLWLEKPRPGKTPYYRVRGSYLGIKVSRSAETDRGPLAGRLKRRWERQIERGEYRDGRAAGPVAPAAPVTFLDAAIAYMQAGGERRRLGPIIEMTGECALRDLPIAAIDQIAIDNAGGALFPGASAPTLNREFYTPVSAVLRRAGRDRPIKRPVGWRGSKATAWLEPAALFAVLNAAEAIDAEFGIYLLTLPYTGMRLRESLRPRLRQLDVGRQTLYLPKTKNGNARNVYLPMHVVVALANHPRGLDRDPEARIFRFHAGGHLYDLLHEALRRGGVKFPPRQNGFHLFCHTYGTWMHRYGGLDNFGLTRTDRWADPRSADRYVHLEVNEEARRADLMPVPKVR